MQEKKPSPTKQPLVVEDESWKQWSSFHMIHHPPGGATAATAYRPPVYVSAPTKAEAVWDL